MMHPKPVKAPKKKRKPMRYRRKPVPPENARHMARVAQLPCVICGAWPVEVHHVICGRYGQSKASDFDTIPLCPMHHRNGMLAIHNGKESWVRRYGLDTDYLPIVAHKLLNRFGYVAPVR